MDKGGKDGSQHEGREKNDLHASLGSVGLVETEPNEQTGSNSETKLRSHVRGHAPILLEDTTSDLHELLRERHGEFRRGRRIIGTSNLLVFLVLVDAVDVSFNNLSHIAFLPNVVPVFSLIVLSGVNNLEHVLGGVFLVVALPSAVPFKVVEQLARILANFSEVNSSTSACKEEEAIEFLKEDGGRLMDRAKNGLACIGELPQKSANGPGTLYKNQ